MLNLLEDKLMPVYIDMFGLHVVCPLCNSDNCKNVSRYARDVYENRPGVVHMAPQQIGLDYLEFLLQNGWIACGRISS